MEPQPPPVTIVDPNKPLGTTELLDHGRDPWRPSRRQVAMAATVVAVAGLAAGVSTLAVSHHRAVATDRATLRTLAFAAHSMSDWDHPDVLTLELVNEGPTSVRVLQVRVAGGAYAAIPIDEPVGHFNSVPLVLVEADRCSPELFSQHPVTLLVDVETPRGSRRAVRAPVPEEVAEQLWRRSLQHCGLDLPDEILSAYVHAVRLEGKELVLEYALQNSGDVSVSVDAVTSGAGVAARAAGLPVDVAPGDVGRLVIRLRVPDCARLAEILSTYGGEGLDGPRSITLEVHHAHASAVVLASTDTATADPERVIDNLPKLARTCPARYFRGVPLSDSYEDGNAPPGH